MSLVRLRLRHPGRVDLAGVTPDRLGGLTADAIAALEVPAGSRLRRLDALFEVETVAGDDDHVLELHDPGGRIDGAGAGMQAGRVEVLGDAGACVGQGMQGGSIHVQGACGAFAAAGMEGGELRIDGDSGDFLGAALAGERKGMRGGTVVVGGNAGDRVGEQMRRGLLLVQGSVGAGCAARMIAGTIVVRGAAGPGAGRGMRRGTVLLSAPPDDLPGTFVDTGVLTLGFFAFLEGHLAALAPAAAAPSGGALQRWVGDRANGGLGEVLAPV